MKPIPPVAPKTPAEIKRIAALLVNPGPQVPGDDSLMDWSTDIPEVQFSPTPHGPPAGGNVLSPRAPLHNRDVKGKRRTNLIDSNPSLLNYGGIQPVMPSSWDGAHHALSVFGTDETNEVNAINMAKLISRIVEYIKNNPADKKLPAREFEQVMKGFWNLITAVYSSKWDLLSCEDRKNFHTLVGEKILNNYAKPGFENKTEAKKVLSPLPDTVTNTNVPVTPLPSKMTGLIEKKAMKSMIMKKSYAQASKANILTSIEDVI